MLHLPKICERRVLIKRPQIKVPSHSFDGQHYWEINKRGYELEKVTSSFLKSGKLRLERTFRPYENAYHRFFIFSVAAPTVENAAQLEVLMTEVALECSVARVDRENEEVLRAEKMSSQSLTKLNESLMSLASNAKEARNRNPTPNPNT